MSTPEQFEQEIATAVRAEVRAALLDRFESLLMEYAKSFSHVDQVRIDISVELIDKKGVRVRNGVYAGSYSHNRTDWRYFIRELAGSLLSLPDRATLK